MGESHIRSKCLLCARHFTCTQSVPQLVELGMTWSHFTLSKWGLQGVRWLVYLTHLGWQSRKASPLLPAGQSEEAWQAPGPLCDPAASGRRGRLLGL